MVHVENLEPLGCDRLLRWLEVEWSLEQENVWLGLVDLVVLPA